MATRTGQIGVAGTAAGGDVRVHLAREDDFRIGPLVVRPSRRTVRHDDGREDVIEPRVMQVLVALRRADGAIVGRDELVDRCWDGRIVGEDAINRVISRLRRLAEGIGAEVFRIETVTRVGYRLATSAEPIVEAAPVGRREAAPPVAMPKSVAVLPFANLTGDAAQDYLADGMAEELITSLSRVPDLKVPARTSTFSYRGRSLDVREIGRQLGVSAVVEGSVRTADDRIRLTVQLVDAATGFHIWSENFDRAVGDLLDLQDELARSVAAVLGRKLAERARGTTSPEAMRAYLQARSVAARFTDDALARSVALLRRAIAIDPAFAGARELLAGVLLMAINSGAISYDAREEARREADHALALDPTLSVARTIIAGLAALQGEWSEAERNFTEALERNESDPIAHEAFAHFVLLPTGQHRRARKHAERALELSPARAQSSLICALCATMRGDSAAVSEYLELASLLGMSGNSPPFRMLRAYCLLAQGRLEDAADGVAAALPAVALEAGGEQVVRDVYRAFGGQGDAGAARAQVSALFDACRGSEDFWRHASLPGLLFSFQALLGAPDEAYRIALAVVERTRLTRHLSTPVVIGMWVPMMASFRSDPRFETVVADLGMTDHWARVGPPDGYTLAEGKLVSD